VIYRVGRGFASPTFRVASPTWDSQSLVPPYKTDRMTFRIVLGCLLAAGPAVRADDLVTLAGKTLKGKLVSVDASAVTFKDIATGADERVPFKAIKAVDLGRKPIGLADGAKYDAVELTDGSTVVCARVRVRKKQVELDPLPASAPAPKIDLPLAVVFTVCRGADDPKARADWQKFVAGRGKRDAFVVRQSEGLNPLFGTVIEGNDAGDVIVFEREDGQRVPLRLSRATGGLLFNQPPRDVIPPTVCRVRDVFGNVLYARAVEVAGSGLKVTTVAGATFDYPDLAGVAVLDFAEGNVAYLSDLAASVAAPEAAAGDPAFTFLKDRTPEGSALRLDGATYPKGLWVFPDTALAYKLNGDYREFKAVVGVDDRIPVANAAARVTVEADGRVLFDEVVRRKDKPRPLTLDVKNVKELRITAGREALYLGGQVDLADARVQK
jgi:hypothetical protein